MLGRPTKRKLTKKKYIYSNKLDASIMLCDLKKVKKLGFFDENFFLYWEDIDLMKRVKESKFKMIKVLNSYAKHYGGKSTVENYKTKIVRKTNFKYGEFIFDLKYNKLRLLKIVRTLLQSVIFIPIYLIFFNQNKLINYFSNLIGTVKFLFFFVSKRKNIT